MLPQLRETVRLLPSAWASVAASRGVTATSAVMPAAAALLRTEESEIVPIGFGSFPGPVMSCDDATEAEEGNEPFA
ncbi:hypothetical protein GCM10010249_19900 [Streptomyces roseolilacinus]|uniref:Uncharacterized protein n=1 Tax=Streptomyces roseolilacinus TaxID=66904 RepID=A0A918EK09_9ACTN|nr:hypothetical protein GCM10010249_19900 [Streptomyces roseolilacinus]